MRRLCDSVGVVAGVFCIELCPRLRPFSDEGVTAGVLFSVSKKRLTPR